MFTVNLQAPHGDPDSSSYRIYLKTKYLLLYFSFLYLFFKIISEDVKLYKAYTLAVDRLVGGAFATECRPRGHGEPYYLVCTQPYMATYSKMHNKRHDILLYGSCLEDMSIRTCNFYSPKFSLVFLNLY